MTGIATGYAGFGRTAVAHASTHKVTLPYSCSASATSMNSDFGTQSGSVTIDVDSPDTITVGKPTSPVTYSETDTLPAFNVEEAHTYEGVAAISASGDVSIKVTAPGKSYSDTTSYDVPKTKLPASGSLTIVVSGTAVPSLTFPQPGTAKATIGTLTEHQTLWDSNGNPIDYGTVDETCVPQSGQDILVQSIPIKPAPPAPHPHATTPTTALSRNPRPLPHPASSAPPHRPTRTSSSATSAASPAAHASPGISEKEALIVGAAAIVTAGIGGTAAWLVALRSLRRTKRLRGQ